MLMSSSDYRESLRSFRPRVFVQGSPVESVPDDPRLAPGVNAVGVTYDYARSERFRPIATATQDTSGATVNRFLHVNRTTSDLLAKLEYTRAVCQETGCAMRYLTMDGFNAVYQVTHRIDAEHGTDYHARFVDYLHEAQAQGLTVGIAMTDAKGDPSSCSRPRSTTCTASPTPSRAGSSSPSRPPRTTTTRRRGRTSPRC